MDHSRSRKWRERRAVGIGRPSTLSATIGFVGRPPKQARNWPPGADQRPRPPRLPLCRRGNFRRVQKVPRRPRSNPFETESLQEVAGTVRKTTGFVGRPPIRLETRRRAPRSGPWRLALVRSSICKSRSPTAPRRISCVHPSYSSWRADTQRGARKTLPGPSLWYGVPGRRPRRRASCQKSDELPHSSRALAPNDIKVNTGHLLVLRLGRKISGFGQSRVTSRPTCLAPRFAAVDDALRAMGPPHVARVLEKYSRWNGLGIGAAQVPHEEQVPEQ